MWCLCLLAVSIGGHHELIPLRADEDIPILRSTDSSFVVEPMLEQFGFDESYEEGKLRSVIYILFLAILFF